MSVECILKFQILFPNLLLIHIRLITSFGAIITILALGIGTFVQQALKYNTTYPSSSEALIPIARYMNGTGTAQYSGTGVTTNDVDTEVESGAYVGLFSPVHTDFTVSAQCNSGNCTWESYQTLAICNTCADLTPLLKMTKVQLEVDNDPKDV